MNKKINMHTHSTFCDGKNSVEEIIVAAIEKGFTTLGFSSHSLFPFAAGWHIPHDDFPEYEKTVREMAAKYADKIQIICGYEADYFPNVTKPAKEHYRWGNLNPDYLIGSVHYVVSDKGFYSVDNSIEKVQKNLIRLYGDGENWSSVNAKKAVGDYFAAEREMLKKCDLDILGHADLIRLRNDKLHYFDENESWYKSEVKATAKAIAKSGVIVEINTGAIARGNMDSLYPSDYFLSLLHDMNVPICVNSDAHTIANLDAAYDRAYAAAKKIGYKELSYPVAGKIIHVDL